jgi:hypothetical protein
MKGNNFLIIFLPVIIIIIINAWDKNL